MDSYEALMSNPMVSSYHMGQTSFPPYSDGGSLHNTYSHLGDMPGSYADTPHSSGTGSMSYRGGYSNSQSSGPSNFGSLPPSSDSFPMPYDPPSLHPQNQQNGAGMAQSQSLQMPAPSSLSQHSSPSSSQHSFLAPTKTVHSCSYCGLVLSSANALIEHKRIHTGDRPFACHICGKRFTQKAHLNIHKRTHTGEKPYACHICNKRFAQSSHLSSHKRIHTGEKPFVCGICNIGFTQKQRLDAHLKKHLEHGGQEGLARLMGVSTRPEHHGNRGRPPHTEGYNMHMMAPSMPYIKQEVNHSEDEDVDHHAPVNGSGAQHQDGEQVATDLSVGDSQYVKAEDDGGGRRGSSAGKTVQGSDQISASSFSSEGMFLHPSGYVAYGGIEDSEESAAQSSGASVAESSNQQGASRRKPAVVRKLPVESSPTEDQENSEGAESPRKFQRFSPLRSDARSDLDDGGAEEFLDTGESVDSKADPPYHANTSRKPNTPAMVTRRAAMPQPDQEVKYPNSRGPNHLDSQYHPYPATNGGDRFPPTGVPPQETLSYTSPRSAAEGDGLVKVNNRVSLVNFTAEELLSHLMKRDDVHKCQFCCIIFQDAAMYHIHRNMHDKADLRRCNMCGQTLADKYDFTAHFLSMHKT